MDSIAIITARGGSKRIPGKNIKDFLGKPIMAYSIETAFASGLFHEVMVSTDDEEIASVAKKYGAVVPFMRSSETSDDFSTTSEVLLEVLGRLRKEHKNYSNACCIYPTAPFITSDSLQKGFDLLVDSKYDAVFPVAAFSFPVLRSLVKNDEGKVVMKWPENLNTRSQDMPSFYHDAGQFYWMNIETFLINKKLYTNNNGAIILNELYVQDIDNEIDWTMAELKYKLINNQK